MKNAKGVFLFFEVCDPYNFTGEQNLKPKLFERKRTTSSENILLGNRQIYEGT